MSGIRMVVATTVFGMLLGASLSIPAMAVDWPQWRGPDRTDVTSEPSGWPSGWPPKRLWGKKVGYGCTSPIMVGQCLYVMGWEGEPTDGNPMGTDTLSCFEAVTGKLLWQRSYSCRYQGRFRVGDTSLYGGPTSTPTFDTASGYLYTLSIDGDLKCWDTRKEGEPVWSVNLYDRYKVAQRPNVKGGLRDYGYSCSPVVQGDAIVTEVGGAAGTLVALDKRTGEQAWRSTRAEPSGHNAGPVPMNVEGIPCLASFGIRELTVVRADRQHAGQTMARCPWPTAFACNIITPAVIGDRVVLSSGHDVCRTAMFQISPGKVREIWSCPYWSEECSPVIHENCLYLVTGRIHCLGLADGNLKWRGGSFGRDSSCLVTGDNKLVVFGTGDLGLVEISTGGDGYDELARVKDVVAGTCYPHIALADGILAVKSREGNVVCLSVRPR
jgi:outer membrane protein assembly factor BamB